MDRLKEVYNTTLLPALENLERERKKLKNLALITACLHLLVAVPFAMWLVALFQHRGLLIWVVSLTGVGVFWCFKELQWKPFKERYARQIMVPLAGALLPKFAYYPQSMIPRELVVKGDFTGICKSGLGLSESYKGDNYFEGTVDKTKLRFSQLKITETRGSGKNRHTVTLFKGLYLVLDFHKEFSGKTVLLPRDSTSSWRQRTNKYLSSLVSCNLKAVTTSNKTFNDSYVTYTDDRVEARYVLSESLMERFLKLGEKSAEKIGGTRPLFSFVDSSLMIGIPLSHRLFEPRFWDGLRNSYDHFVGYQEVLHCVRSTVEELSMNRRIWTKR
jgi:hypothetical protein